MAALDPDPPPRDVLPDGCVWQPLQAKLAAGSSAGLWRAGGRVVKLLRPDREGHPHRRSSTHPAHPFWWRREADFYASELAASLRSLRPPRCEVVERADGSVALVLPELRRPATAWPLAQYAYAARRLGRMQGAAAAARDSLSRAEWLSRRWLREDVSRRAQLLVAPRPGPFVAEAVGLWRERERLLDAVEALPQTLCHLDCSPLDLFDDGVDVLAVGWAFVGVGALGEDAGNLVAAALFEGCVPVREAHELDRLVAGGYLAGLRDAGWDGDERLVRLGMTASTAVRYVWAAPHLASGEWRAGDPARILPTLELLAGWAGEARALVARVG